MNGRKALVVGIDDYPGSRLYGCVSDANIIAKLLEKNYDGTPNFDVVLKTDIETKAELMKAIKETFKSDVDCALFFFSGHGFVDSVSGYIVTPDYVEGDMGLSMSEITKIVNVSKCKNRIVILDCCHSGNMGNMDTGEITTIKEGVTILSACRSGEYAIEFDGRGLFTSLLSNALEGEASTLMGDVTPGAIYALVDRSLGPWDQRPVFKTNVSSFISLRKTSPPISRDVLSKITDYFATPDHQYILNPSFEYTNHPEEKHELKEPYANEDNVKKFKDLQIMASAGLVKPVDENYMYYAAMKSKSCKLTVVGHHYWSLVKNKRI
ncbi:MAG TPA: caspase family protein [Candidatus Methanomethylophilaceae archaeon]|nr:caspase family protein [Candidatus Methanomethylophilaceae archaeon]